MKLTADKAREHLAHTGELLQLEIMLASLEAKLGVFIP